MDTLLSAIQNNSFRETCPKIYTKEKEELRQLIPREQLWGAGVRGLNPSRLMTAWLMQEDPLMVMAGLSYRQTEVRDKTFALQQEAATALKGNRKLPKSKVAEALAAMRPTEEQTKMIAAVLLAMKHVQTVCWNTTTKTIWTMPEDVRQWSKEKRTLWVDATQEQMLDWQSQPDFGGWLDAREKEGDTISWPEADGTFEEIKSLLALDFPELSVHSILVGKKAKKEDYARVLGKAQALQHLMEK